MLRIFGCMCILYNTSYFFPPPLNCWKAAIISWINTIKTHIELSIYTFWKWIAVVERAKLKWLLVWLLLFVRWRLWLTTTEKQFFQLNFVIKPLKYISFYFHLYINTMFIMFMFMLMFIVLMLFFIFSSAQFCSLFILFIE